MGLGIPPLGVEIMLESQSNPLKSRILVRRSAVGHIVHYEQVAGTTAFVFVSLFFKKHGFNKCPQTLRGTCLL